jgi:hypothetical protein
MPMLFGLQQNSAHGEVLYNGANTSGTVAQYGANRYTFEVSEGDYLTLTAIKPSGTFRQPAIKLYAPNGTPILSYNVSQTALLTNRAIMSGTYTAVVYTTSASGGAFDYVLRLAQLPHSFIVPAGDEGGLLMNGVSSSGSLLQGDLDLWYFAANAGDYVAVRAGATGATGLPIQMDLYSPNGDLLPSSASSGTDASIEITNANNGTYMLAIRAQNIAATGAYRLNLAQMPGNSMAAGSLINGVTNHTSLSLGGLDQWTLYACKSNLISLRCESQGGSVYYPRIQLFSQEGHSLGDTAATRLRVNALDRRAPYSGRFTVLIQSANFGGQGPYLLSGTGISVDGMTVCSPIISGRDLDLGGIRGIPDAPFVLLSTTNIMLPRTDWEPLTTGRFNQWGAFEFRTPFNRTEPQRYFLLKIP